MQKIQLDLPVSSSSINQYFPGLSEPVACLHTEIPDFVFRALFTHRKYRTDSINAQPINGPVPAAIFFIFGINLVTPMLTDLTVVIHFGVFQIGPQRIELLFFIASLNRDIPF